MSIITSFFRSPIRASVSSLVILIATAASPLAYGQSFNVGDTSDLNTAISTINGNPNNSYSLNFINGFTLGQSATAISSNSTITILGNSNTLDAANLFSPLTITSGTVTLQNLNIVNANPEITVNGGTLIGTTFSLQGAISNSGSVQFNQTTNGNFGGSVSGSGSVEINSTGFVTFSGTNSYSGGTTVDSGSTLIGTTNSLQNDFSNNGIVRFGQPTSGTYSGNMSGVGSVQINGPGPITFAGSNSYSGGTSINGGSTLVGSTFSLQGGRQR